MEGGREGRKYIRGSGNTGGKAQVRASRATAPLRVSLVPEAAAAVGNAGARGAGVWGPFAEGECKASFSKGRARDHLGLQLGRGQILSVGRELGSEVMVLA